MIVCPNCSHANPEAAVQCEACYTPLPTLTTCPSCGASVQSNADFCGQCGASLQGAGQPAAALEATHPDTPDLPELVTPDPLVTPKPLSQPSSSTSADTPSPGVSSQPSASPQSAPVGATQLQVSQAQLLHVQTDTQFDLPAHLPIIRIGKPNDRVPPDIDVSGLQDSEIVSRVHASIRVEGDIYYIEDVGSSNGTYINNAPLPSGNRHRLRAGDRIALGKGDKVSFIFQVSG
ncbi:Oxoglutarate dehydrogenase inhibitor [Halomicronema hongdechloris C2206]|uniref:Oxoglutarate dehydrogenase inhibitor n=1 Tax=Halomicronema hongdechloris C2206 TaxID=1641165 RepID=A0A1Z3HQG0_9CYAN|nr:FHA domain-containing protein [Halomicronema hongdechloris]ASC72367.1 Oxoglutarate dehydrogenase inhibitor [Halomicronema hongdechloris C2206]